MRTLSIRDVDHLVGLINAQAVEQVILTDEVQGRVAGHLVYALGYPVEPGGNPQLERRAATLYYSIVKDRAVPVGCERLALIVTLAFLADNGYRPTFSPREMYATASRDDSRPGEAMRILEDLASLIFTSIHPVPGGDPRAVATTDA
ncbi:MAG: hypothetical protein L0H41_17000 [Microlunatus sp.]|nr:hypothetical protein [Microlunatus sp.]